MSNTVTIETFWAVAYERWTPQDGWITDIQYEKTTERQLAIMGVLRRLPTLAQDIQRKKARIVAVAPAIGYTSRDKGQTLIL